MQKLTATAVKQAKPKAKPYKLSDGGGLYLHVMPKGKYWRYKYRFAGKEKLLALGVYPDVTLAIAALPSAVLGPVLLPPWNRHLVLPLTAGALHLCRVRFDSALHWMHVTRPPRVV